MSNNFNHAFEVKTSSKFLKAIFTTFFQIINTSQASEICRNWSNTMTKKKMKQVIKTYLSANGVSIS